MIYSARNKTLTTSDNIEYYFYTGQQELDYKATFIANLLERGYTPNRYTELVEMYLDLCKGEDHFIKNHEEKLKTKEKWLVRIMKFITK